MEEKVKALLEDTGFCQKLAECKDIEGITALLAANGVELTAEQTEALLNAAGSELKKIAHEEGTLSDAELENVTGSAFWPLKQRPLSKSTTFI